MDVIARTSPLALDRHVAMTKPERICEKIFLLDVIRNHLDYTLRYEHRFHQADVTMMRNTLLKLQMVIDKYNSLMNTGADFDGLSKQFFVTFDWIERTFQKDLEENQNRRISVLHVYYLEDHLKDLKMMADEMEQYRPSLLTQLFKDVIGRGRKDVV